MDPLAEKYPSISPYVYCADNPVMFTDDGGMDLVIFGANNSSITFTTDLIDLSVNVGKWGIDWKGNFCLEGNATLSAALDLAGILDPTGAADIANAILLATDRDYGGAIQSGLSVIPVGDVLKVGKVGKDLRIIGDAIGGNNFTRRNFRKNLIKLTGENPSIKQAHHIFPHAFKEQFKKAGIDVNNPAFGAWLDAKKHNKHAYWYNKEWQDYLSTHPEATKDEYFEQAKILMREIYGE